MADPEQTSADEPEQGSPAWWEQRQPSILQSLNRFCENWIFAFIVAMIIRQGFIEAYRIPTASMEPMLYGDPALTKGDFVAVDKFLFRFTGPERWGVTVFQYPWPEIVGPQGLSKPLGAYYGDGTPADNLITRPLIHRNFVKRCLAMPGDVFFFRGGDLHLQQPDGGFAVPSKSADLIEHLWQDIYRHGVSEGYLPWEGVAEATVVDDEGLVACDFGAEGAVRFTQPLRNLYVKRDDVGVRPRGRRSGTTKVDVSLTDPVFDFDGRTGSIWDYDHWDVFRLRSDNLDAEYNNDLTALMDEYVGDLRIAFSLLEHGGLFEVAQVEGIQHTLRLSLTPGGWQLAIEDRDGVRILEQGGDVGTGPWALAQCDDLVWVEHGGAIVSDRHPVPAVDADAPAGRSEVLLSGSGKALLAGLTISRDVHYCQSGFLSDQTEEWKQLEARIRSLSLPEELRHYQVQRLQFLRNRRGFIEALVDEQLRERLLAQVVAEEEGVLSQRGTDWLEPIGVSPETALRAPDDAYLLMGDNSPFSFDSRNWGWVPSINLRGEVLVSAQLPFGRWQIVH